MEWHLYAPEFSPEFLINGTLPQDASEIALRRIESFSVTDSNQIDFYFFLDRYLFKTHPQKPTLSNVQLDFGDTSPIFRKAIALMAKHVPDLEGDTELDTAFRQWQRFLSIAYGKFDDSHTMFFVHTYLSVFAKLLAYAVLQPTHYIQEDEIKRILTGDIFNKLNVERFVEGDFYYWAGTNSHFSALLPIFRSLISKIAEYDFANVQEDILKGVYQELIDLETRHALGEYYTPDWLCERIINEMPFKTNSRILDPACGSGSFLRAAVARLKKENCNISGNELASQVVGIDIHPLSVQIAKTTLLLALGDKIKDSPKPVTLQIYLANSLFLPDDAASLFGNVFYVRVDGEKYPLDISALMQFPGDFDAAIELCQSTIDFYKERELGLPEFAELLKKKLQTKTAFSNLAADFHKIYRAMRQAKIAGRDTIWKFILQNLYKPVFLSRTFDFVVKNPPWLTYSDIRNADYQRELFLLANGYHLIPASKANIPNLEIAAIFQSHSASYFLKNGGLLAFVLPRSLLSADQHDNSRSGSAIGFKLLSVWDLEKISPLFRVPSCVLFSQAIHERSLTASLHRKISKDGIVGKKIYGKLPKSQIDWAKAKDFLSETEVTWFYNKLTSGSKPRTALSIKGQIDGNKKGHYAPLFKKGAEIIPRCFYFIEPEQKISNYVDCIVQCKTSAKQLSEAKMPWKAFTLQGRVNSKFLFYTALAKNILPYALVNPPIVLLPIKVVEINKVKTIKLLDEKIIFSNGDNGTAEWFAQASRLWQDNRTETNTKKDVSLYAWLNWQNKLVSQNLNSQFLVIYTASAADASAVVISRATLNLEFIAETTQYLFTSDHEDEAHYVAAFLNSKYANEAIKDFQARGLFGARHVHKKILDVPLPIFDHRNESHKAVASLAKSIAIDAAEITNKVDTHNLSPSILGRLRRTIRNTLADKFLEIDKLIRIISTS